MALSPTPRRFATILALVVALALLARPSGAELTTSALSWVRLPGSESCISTQELGARVEKHLGRSVLVSPSVADVSLEGRVEPTASASSGARKYRVVIGGARRDGTLIGTRELVSPGADCRALDDGLVLVVALMIDPAALSPVRPDLSAAPLPFPREIMREVVHERVVHEIERVKVESPPWLVEASVGGVAAVERVPGTAPGLVVAVRAGPSRLVAFQMSLGVVPSGELSVGSRSVDFTILEGGFAYCPAVALTRHVEIGGCAGLRIGAVRSHGRGFGNDLDVDRGLADLALGPQLEITLAGPVFATASANALVRLLRLETTMTDAVGKTIVLDERGALSAELGFGVGVRFSP